MPPPEPLRGADLAAFQAQVAPAMARIRGMEEVMYAQNQPKPQASTPRTQG